MGLIDAFATEDRVSVKFSDFYQLMKTAAKAEVITEIALVEEDTQKSGEVIRKLAIGPRPKGIEEVAAYE